jgi:GNAT superfamily N-acetyltransferase
MTVHLKPVCHPLTPDRRKDFERLFGERGAYGGCWCMFWRMRSSEWRNTTREENKRGIRRIVRSGPPPGLLAYIQDDVAGWVSVGPRETFPLIERSRVRPRLSDKPTWSINCFFIDPRFRGTGLMRELLRAAVAHAREGGARLIEAYPLEPEGGRAGTMDGYVGIASVFRKAGFRKVRPPVGTAIRGRYILGRL